MALDPRERPCRRTRPTTHEGSAAERGLCGRSDVGGHCRPDRTCGAATSDNAESHDPPRLP
eukprot:6534620-Alexandrium_andersonii.AAC.1